MIRKDFVKIKPFERKKKHGLEIAGEEEETAEYAKVLGFGPVVEGLKKGDTIVYKNFNLSIVVDPDDDNKKSIYISDNEIIEVI